MARIGFVGLGNMGLPMAQNLVRAGHVVAGYDVVQRAVGRLSAAGGAAATSVAQACAGAETVITMLPAGEHVRAVYMDAEGVLASAAPGTLLIDSSTIDVATARTVASAAQARGLDMIDAPVSGGVKRALDGTLAVMVGGEADTIDRCMELLGAMGSAIFRTGKLGSGHAMKALNNAVSAAGLEIGRAHV